MRSGNLKLAYRFEFIENEGGMRRAEIELGSKVLAGPVLVMFAVSPEARGANIVNKAFVGAPDLGPVLAVAQRQLPLGVFG